MVHATAHIDPVTSHVETVSDYMDVLTSHTDSNHTLNRKHH